MICVIDNHDSFTYNLVQILLKNDHQVQVFKNNQVSLARLKENQEQIEGFLLSPGPGHPRGAGVCAELVACFYEKIPIMGVCLGHQILAEFFGARVVHAPRIMHGKISAVRHDGRGIYEGVAQGFPATRYHSLIVEENSVPQDLEVSSWVETEGAREVMGLRHKKWPIEGVQFHPESILTSEGEGLLRRFFS